MCPIQLCYLLLCQVVSQIKMNAQLIIVYKEVCECPFFNGFFFVCVYFVGRSKHFRRCFTLTPASQEPRRSICDLVWCLKSTQTTSQASRYVCSRLSFIFCFYAFNIIYAFPGKWTMVLQCSAVFIALFNNTCSGVDNPTSGFIYKFFNIFLASSGCSSRCYWVFFLLLSCVALGLVFNACTKIMNCSYN